MEMEMKMNKVEEKNLQNKIRSLLSSYHNFVGGPGRGDAETSTKEE
jgi:hypothetical protein